MAPQVLPVRCKPSAAAAHAAPMLLHSPPSPGRSKCHVVTVIHCCVGGVPPLLSATARRFFRERFRHSAQADCVSAIGNFEAPSVADCSLQLARTGPWLPQLWRLPLWLAVHSNRVGANCASHCFGEQHSPFGFRRHLCNCTTVVLTLRPRCAASLQANHVQSVKGDGAKFSEAPLQRCLAALVINVTVSTHSRHHLRQASPSHCQHLMIRQKSVYMHTNT
jgi:hypothetical protein